MTDAKNDGACGASLSDAGLGCAPPAPTFDREKMNMEYELKQGQALVITGPQGCGKSTLARKIAEERGAFIEVDASQLETPQGLNDLLTSEPAALIVNGWPGDDDMQDWLKAVIASNAIKVDRLYSAPKMVKTPAFIFCVNTAALPGQRQAVVFVWHDDAQHLNSQAPKTSGVE
jgi:gluconate kinase